MGMKTNLKISNLPKDLSDMDIISGLKRLIHPMSQDSDFKKIIFKRSRSGSVSLFVKFANKKHLKEAHTKLRNHAMNGEMICVEYANDFEIPKATKSLSVNRASTKYRSGLIIQSMQNGKERMISIIPNCKAMAIKSMSRKRKK